MKNLKLWLIILLLFLISGFLIGCASGEKVTLETGVEEGRGIVEIDGKQVARSNERAERVYEGGEEITLKAKEQGYEFKGWKSNAKTDEFITRSSEVDLTMTGDKTYLAVFESDHDLILERNSMETFDFSDGAIDINAPEYKTYERIFISLFPTYKGDVYDLGSFSTSLEPSQADLMNKESATELDESVEYPFGVRPEFLRREEKKLLRNHKTLSEVETAASPPSQDEPRVGSEEEFWILENFSIGHDFEKKTAVLESKISDQVLIWTTEDVDVPWDEITNYVNEFIVFNDKLQNYFGREPDKEEFSGLKNAYDEVNIVLTDLPSVPGDPDKEIKGYFYAADLYSQSKRENSNEGKFIYVNADMEQDFTKGTIAHEYQHLLHYNETALAGKSSSETWIDEGFSELARDIAGYGYKQGYGTKRIDDYLDEFWETSVIDWEREHRSYGASYLFTRYIYEQYDQDILEEIYSYSGDAQEAIANYWKTPSVFSETFANYSLAVLSDNLDVNFGSKYSFDIDLTDYSQPDYKDLSSGEDLTGQEIVGWGIGYIVIDFDRVAYSDQDDLIIEIEGAESEGDFWGAAVREGEAVITDDPEGDVK